MIHEESDIPIESQEQAQLLEQKFREQAIANNLKGYVTLEGIKSPEDVVEPGECEGCGAPVPEARIKALMSKITLADGSEVWKANPNAKLCVECASHNEQVKKLYRSRSTEVEF